MISWTKNFQSLTDQHDFLLDVQNCFKIVKRHFNTSTTPRLPVKKINSLQENDII